MEVRSSLPVVVGWDESPGARAALAWAVSTARRLETGLLILQNFDVDNEVALAGATVDPAEVEASLAKALAFVAAEAPQVPVRGERVSGHVVGSLIEASKRASVLVVGSRGHSRFVSALIGSVSDAVASHSFCPVIVVRGDTDYPEQAPVVVGADGSETSREAVAFAARMAAARHAPLIAVNATSAAQMIAPEVIMIDEAQTEAIREEAARFMAESLGGVHTDHPDLKIIEKVSDRPAAQALVDAAKVNGAQLVVVGSHGRGGFAGMLLGSVSRAVLHHAPCPVAVVRPVT